MSAEPAVPTPPMFTPFTLRGMELANRVVVSPMCMYHAVDGLPGDFQLVHLGSRAIGGAGLVITEMTNVTPEGRISPACTGMYRPAHRDAWKRIVDFVHGESEARIGIQLAHAGRKGAIRPAWERDKGPLGDEGWELIAPSAIPFGPGSATPREMTRDDMETVRDAFAQATLWSAEAGFDMIELHMGHGYLLSSFMSPLSNRREDEFGGDLEGRMRFPLEVFAVVHANWPSAKPISARISAIDWDEGGNTIEDGIAMARMLVDAGLDIVDVSTGNVTSNRRPVPDGLFQTPYSEAIRQATGGPTMTVGNFRSAADINAVIAEGRADLCCLAKWHLYDPYFTLHAAHEQGVGLAWANSYKQVERMLAG